MEAAASSGGGPAPFLLKTYDMVDDSSTDEIVSWSSNKNSFVVWNPPEFARLLLPAYFKHNNFSSFIRQLNTYGFRKIDPERWEFSNDDFVKDKKHLLKNIHRRKPIHSHSHPQGSSVDPERAAFEDEMERLSREKAALEENILGFKQQRSTAKLQLEDLNQRVDSMEQRQENLLAFLQKAVQNPTFVEHLARKIECMDISAYNKKRRKPQVDQSKPILESSLLNNNSCSTSRPESGSVFHQDFSNKLRLELSPAVNLVSHSTESSTEDGGSPQKKISEFESKDTHTRTESNLYVPEIFEFSDTGTSFTFNMDSSLSQKVPANDIPRIHSLQQRLTSNEEVDGHVSCHLNLTLASCPLQVNKGLYSSRIPQPSNNVAKTTELRYDSSNKESDSRPLPSTRNLGHGDASLSSPQEGPNENPGPAAAPFRVHAGPAAAPVRVHAGPAAAPVRVNDLFWEQFLTERPGSSENEEASSIYRANPYEEQEDKRSGLGISRNAKNMEQLTL